ncbi:MAG TPA: TonB-dependent receptor [Sphingopyxis sp.]|jgi:iron complex outermembrane receptor protein|uniref:TonB-dependent receptor n=1 Tax=Sphingopyxis sp. TaxID=1908224 RepID=UPI002E0E6A6A|nr:TonB-dependent receptor [Sphingopyxis sp.]
MRHSFVSRFLFLGTALASLSSAAHAAQDPAAEAAVDAAAAGEIIVTAQRRSQDLTDVPISVGVVGGDSLRDIQAGGEDIIALSGRVPGLYAETTTGRIFPRFYIRGLGNIDFYLGASQPVSVIQDDIVLEHVVLKSKPLFDVRQVEVLRGPQGSLFGRNTTAGIIKFDTNRPTMDFDARGQVSVGSLGTVSADFGIGGPIVADTVAVRVSGLYQRHADWIDNIYTGPSADGTVAPRENALGGFEEKAARAQLLINPDDRFSMLVSVHARDVDGTATVFYRDAIKRGSNSAGTQRRDQIANDEAQNNPQRYKGWGGSLNVSLDLGGATLTAISGYENARGFSRGDTDGGASALFAFPLTGFGQSQGQIRDLDQLTQEIRLASPDDQPFTWQLGGYYFHSRDITDFYQRAFFLTTAARNPNNWVRLRNENTSWALFGQASYDLSPAFTVTAGARWTRDTKETRLLKTADTAAGVVTYRGRRDVRLSDSEPSWDLSALYRLSDDISAYARVARGFRGPTIQGRSAVFNADFTTADSETILSWEAGLKGSFWDNRARFNIAGFTYTVKDIQLNGNDANGNGVLFNADKARAYGMEADLELRPAERLTLNFGASYLHSRIRDPRVFAQVCALNGTITCTVEDPVITVATPFGPGYFAPVDGNPLPNAPEYSLNFAARYGVPVGNSGEFFVATDWNVQGYTSFVLYDTKEFNASGNFEGGAKVGYADEDRGYEIAAFVRNITNEKNLKGVIENYRAAIYNDPRIIGVSASLRFR